MELDRALTPPEVAELDRLEATIREGMGAFVAVGLALLRIRDGRLYRSTHTTFEAYVRGRWGVSRAHAYRQIDAANAAGRLSPIGDIKPQTESQMRPLLRLAPDQQPEAWAQAVADAGGRSPTARHVEVVVRRVLGVPTPAVPKTTRDAPTPKTVPEKIRSQPPVRKRTGREGRDSGPGLFDGLDDAAEDQPTAAVPTPRLGLHATQEPAPRAASDGDDDKEPMVMWLECMAKQAANHDTAGRRRGWVEEHLGATLRRPDRRKKIAELYRVLAGFLTDVADLLQQTDE